MEGRRKNVSRVYLFIFYFFWGGGVGWGVGEGLCILVGRSRGNDDVQRIIPDMRNDVKMTFFFVKFVCLFNILIFFFFWRGRGGGIRWTEKKKKSQSKYVEQFLVTGCRRLCVPLFTFPDRLRPYDVIKNPSFSLVLFFYDFSLLDIAIFFLFR